MDDSQGMSFTAASAVPRSAACWLGVLLAVAGLLTSSLSRAEARPLLASPYGELCTTCEGYLLCTPETAADDLQPVLLHVEKMDFWQQIGTIWTWLKHLFAPVRPDTRHLSIFAPAADGGWQPEGVRQRITLDLRTNRADYPGGWIDRGDGAWHDPSGRRLGRCEAVDGRALLAGAAP
jgi:hypothetical protein